MLLLPSFLWVMFSANHKILSLPTIRSPGEKGCKGLLMALINVEASGMIKSLPLFVKSVALILSIMLYFADINFSTASI